MEPLLHEVGLDPIPHHKRGQHVDAAQQIAVLRGIETDGAAVRGVEARVDFLGLGDDDGRGGRARGIGAQGAERVVGGVGRRAHGQVADVEAARAVLSGAVGAEVLAEEAVAVLLLAGVRDAGGAAAVARVGEEVVDGGGRVAFACCGAAADGWLWARKVEEWVRGRGGLLLWLLWLLLLLLCLGSRGARARSGGS